MARGVAFAQCFAIALASWLGLERGTRIRAGRQHLLDWPTDGQTKGQGRLPGVWHGDGIGDGAFSKPGAAGLGEPGSTGSCSWTPRQMGENLAGNRNAHKWPSKPQEL